MRKTFCDGCGKEMSDQLGRPSRAYFPYRPYKEICGDRIYVIAFASLDGHLPERGSLGRGDICHDCLMLVITHPDGDADKPDEGSDE